MLAERGPVLMSIRSTCVDLQWGPTMRVGKPRQAIAPTEGVLLSIRSLSPTRRWSNVPGAEGLGLGNAGSRPAATRRHAQQALNLDAIQRMLRSPGWIERVW